MFKKLVWIASTKFMWRQFIQTVETIHTDVETIHTDVNIFNRGMKYYFMICLDNIDYIMNPKHIKVIHMSTVKQYLLFIYFI